MAINPPPIAVPNVADPKLAAFLKQLKDAFYQLWFAYGAGTGIAPVAFGGTGAETAAAARVNLGLEIGVNVQAFDAGLLSIAGLTTAANQMIYTTAVDTYAVTGLTSQARSLLDDTSFADMRTTLGLGAGSTVTFDTVTATTSLTASALTATGFFTSRGIDDNATAEVVELSGAAGSEMASFTKDAKLPAPTVPATAAASGSAGQISWDSSFIYVCVASNQWKRAAIATW